mmetsp:Transcript_17052/g.31029  ORF Transcript_17052/g.31029 Transcript_17052/m.31029 type:complete len:86 (+) Transcript_17052:1181-1438(+)
MDRLPAGGGGGGAALSGRMIIWRPAESPVAAEAAADAAARLSKNAQWRILRLVRANMDEDEDDEEEGTPLKGYPQTAKEAVVNTM